MRKIFQFIILLGTMAAYSACNPNLVFEQYQPVKNRNWGKDSMLVFSVPVSDTSGNHNLYINVRNDIDYAYSNIWLFINIKQPNGAGLEDKFEIALADPAGKWLGEGFGGLKTREVIFRKNVFFPVPGNYKITIQQGMREDVLPGISDVGVRIEKAE